MIYNDGCSVDEICTEFSITKDFFQKILPMKEIFIILK